MAPGIKNIGTIWSWVVSFTPQPLELRRMWPWWTLHKKTGCPRSGQCKKQNPCPSRYELRSSSMLLLTSQLGFPVVWNAWSDKSNYVSSPIPVLRRGSAANRLLELWVRIPLGAWMSVSCVVRQRSLRGPDHSSSGVLPTVVCLSVIVKPR